MAGDGRYDIVIVGLGPVGAVAANLAGAAGFRTLVIERGDAPYDKPRAIVFDAEIMRVFASIGLADELTAVTRPLDGSVYIGADRAPIRTFRAHPRAHERAWHPSNLFYQPQLEAILRAGLERYPNVTVRGGTSVTDIDIAGDTTTIRFDGDAVTARFVLACDGASSAVRKSLGIALDDIGFEERWLVVDTDVTGPMRWPEDHAIPDEVRDGRYSLMVCDPERPATLIPGRGTHRRWEYMLLPGEGDAEVVTDAWLQPQLARWVDPADVTILRTAVYRFRALIATRWRQNSVFLLGDAAHQTPPFFGQGMCHGIRDAAQLMWRLALVRDGLSEDALLDSYQPEREPHVRAIMSASVAAGAEVCKLDPAEARARDAAFRAIERERAGGTVAMTDVVPPIRAGLVDAATGGERLPEFVIGDRHVDTLLDGRFTLLVAGDAGIADPRWNALGGQRLAGLADADNHLAAWFQDAGADWAIVRPDRYVYAIGHGQRALESAAARLFEAIAARPSATQPIRKEAIVP